MGRYGQGGDGVGKVLGGVILYWAGSFSYRVGSMSYWAGSILNGQNFVLLKAGCRNVGGRFLVNSNSFHLLPWV